MITTAATLCLAMNIYHEARGESLAGQLAVAQVVMNRVESPRFPDSVCDVVHQGKYWDGHPVRNQCHFSWWCDGRSDSPTNEEAWSQSIHLAWRVQHGETDITEGATHYFNPDKANPYWAKPTDFIVKIGKHSFYK